MPAARPPRIPAPIQWILLAAVLSVPLVRIFEPLENQMFDARLALRRASPWPKDLVMVPITDAAMKENGRWPWPREKIAELLDTLEADGVKTVLLDFIVGAKTTPEADARLAKSLSHSAIAIGYSREGDPQVPRALAGAMLPIHAYRAADPRRRFAPGNLVVPEDSFAAAAAGIGHTIFSNLGDGKVRGHMPLLTIEGVDGALPSLPLVAWLAQRGFPASSVACDGKTLTLPNGKSIPLWNGEMYLDFAIAPPLPGEWADDAPRSVDVRDVLAHPGSDRMRAQLGGALALVHIDSVSEPDTLVTPASDVTPGGRILAWSLRTFDSGRTPRSGSRSVALLACIALALAAAVPLSRRPPAQIVAATLGAVAVVVAAGCGLVPLADFFLPIVGPAAFVSMAGLMLASFAARAAESDRRQLRALLASSQRSSPSAPAISGPAVSYDGVTNAQTKILNVAGADAEPQTRPAAVGPEALLGGQPLAEPVELGKYLVKRSLGRGGMGAIFLARDRDLDRLVALKVLEAADEEAFHRFRREALAVARIVHPNVVQIHEVGLDASVPFLVMEYVAGGSLSDFLRNPETPSPLPWPRAVRILSGIAAGLGAAHAAGIVHRDVKPSNLLMVSFEGDVAKIADFGIAKLSGGEALTREGSFVGTIGYMSPEQAMGLEVDARSDVYSLGIALYRMVTGRAAFEGSTAQVLRKAVVEPVPDPRKWADVPDALADLLARMTAIERADRPRDGNETAALLDALLR